MVVVAGPPQPLHTPQGQRFRRRRYGGGSGGVPTSNERFINRAGPVSLIFTRGVVVESVKVTFHGQRRRDNSSFPLTSQLLSLSVSLTRSE